VTRAVAMSGVLRGKSCACTSCAISTSRFNRSCSTRSASSASMFADMSLKASASSPNWSRERVRMRCEKSPRLTDSVAR
jgi:hypothetical protein